MRHISILTTFFVLVVFIAKGQELSQGSIKIISDPRIDSLLQLHISHSAEFPVVEGYRIQIFMASGNDALDLSEKVKEEFIEEYPDIPVYLTFGEPNYRVRIGDYRTRLEAERFLEKLSRDYPGSWVTRDMINFPKLSKRYKDQSYE